METEKKICIQNAEFYDPAQNWNGEHRDIYIAEGKISTPFDDPDIVIDAGGKPAMAGGIDPFCHLASPGQIFARMTTGHLLSPDEIGKAYARMGYVHAHQPFTTLLTAREVQRSLNLIPYIDKSFRVSIDLRDMGKNIKNRKYLAFCDEARALIHLTGAIGLFLTFPYLKHKQQYYIQKNVSAKKSFEFFSAIEDQDIFPIAIWGMPGLLEKEIPVPDRFLISGLNKSLKSETSMANAKKFLDAGGKADIGLNHGEEYLSVNSIDKYLPGTLSIDAGIHNPYPLRYETRQVPLESEESMPEWMFMGNINVTRQIALSSISPPSGDMNRIPVVTAWLMNNDERPQLIENILGEKNMGLFEIARLTRLEPARQIGLDDSGHLKTGARANVAIYDLKPDMGFQEKVKALSNCWCLVKDGIPVRENGSFSNSIPSSKIRYREIDFDPSILKHTDLLQNPTLRLENLSITKKSKTGE